MTLKLLEGVNKISKDDENFEEKAKEIYLSVRMKGYSSDWRSLLNQFVNQP